ncbi:testis-specific serine/threonine-protein kinase 4-like [Belonocnema kinseyi]|uniref:testis-specific serine/threonine-protein kinase 4-like n=1 Tax=Belonocnema kinseyi TaxID=2817044 RepID=UPI00143DABC9|nr:testis-specific serine/threonine-protein kinase 4-like [Belonocnema kinseyi]
MLSFPDIVVKFEVQSGIERTCEMSAIMQTYCACMILVVAFRDIKCENRLLDHEYAIKLSDFGFARGNIKTKNGVPILSETFCGSYAYASLEILKGIPCQPQLSNIWSISTDITPLDFLLWDPPKTYVYAKPLPRDEIEAEEVARQRLLQGCASFTPEMIQSATQDLTRRAKACLMIGGCQFEPSLKHQGR